MAPNKNDPAVAALTPSECRHLQEFSLKLPPESGVTFGRVFAMLLHSVLVWAAFRSLWHLAYDKAGPGGALVGELYIAAAIFSMIAAALIAMFCLTGMVIASFSSTVFRIAFGASWLAGALTAIVSMVAGLFLIFNGPPGAWVSGRSAVSFAALLSWLGTFSGMAALFGGYAWFAGRVGSMILFWPEDRIRNDDMFRGTLDVKDQD